MADETLTNAELVVLSLISERPLHGYQLEQEIAARNMRAWTDLATSSIYYILRRLEERGLVAEVGQGARGQGKRSRKVLGITPRGEKVWKAATLEALRRPSITYTNFLLGLHNLWNIPPEEALAAVQSYRAWLEADLQRQREALHAFEVPVFPLDVLFDYSFVLGDAELRFLDDLINRLQEPAGGA